MDTFPGLFVGLVIVLVHLGNATTIVQEVDHGQLATLHCPSNDESHRFQYWHLERPNKFIGPGNQMNPQKYKYEVLTGTLFIDKVSTSENGRYTCVCKHTENHALSSESIELVVRKDWEEVYETDHTTNVYRITLLIAVALILVALLIIIYNLRPHRSALFRETSVFIFETQNHCEYTVKRACDPRDF